MKRNRRTKSLGWRIFLGFICFLLLAFLLYAIQLVSSYLLRYENATTELYQIREALNSQAHYEDFLRAYDLIFKQSIQKAALMLEDEEISYDKLEALAEEQLGVDTIMVFHEDGTILHSYGIVEEDPDFLAKLQGRTIETAENGHSYIALPFREDTYLAVGFDFDIAEIEAEKTRFDMYTVAELAQGMVEEILVASKDTGSLIYGPDVLLGENIASFSMQPLDEQSIVHVLVIDQHIMLAAVLEHGDYLLMSIFSVFEILQGINAAVIPALLGFGFLIFLLLLYTDFIRTDMCMGRLGKIHYTPLGKKRYLNTLLCRKLAGFALIGIVCMICVVYCLQLLVRSDEQRQNVEYRLNLTAEILKENQEVLQELEKQDLGSLVEKAQEIRSMVNFKPDLLSPDNLSALARVQDVNAIYVMDEDGETVAGNTSYKNFSIGSDPYDDTYPFWDVVNGYVESHAEVIWSDTRSQNKDMLYVGVPNEGNRGMILLTIPYDTYKNTWQKDYGIEATLRKAAIDSQSMLLAVETGSMTCVFDSSDSYTGLPVSDYGINEEFLRSGYSGTHRFDGQDSLITTIAVLDWTLIYITPMQWISANSWIFTSLVIAISLLVVMLAVFPQLVVRRPGDDLHKPMRKVRSVNRRSQVDASIVQEDQVELEEKQREKKPLSKRWVEMNATAKLRYMIRMLMVPFLIGFMLLLLINRHTEGDSLMVRIMQQNWDKSINVYAFAYVSIVVAGVWFIARILKRITLFVTGTFSQRWKTSGILISNIIRYAALIFSFFFTLQNFGVDTSTLITSASMFTLIIGFGSQSFVADMISGVFLIFEGTFRVGDIVTIDNWHGEVVEVGLRSTKVKNNVGNVKIFQNSRISGAVNMTTDRTYAVCDIMLPPGEKLENYEKKLMFDFFAMARETIPQIKYPLEYDGVVAINGDNVTLRISVKCIEGEREYIRRELCRALKLWREQN